MKPHLCQIAIRTVWMEPVWSKQLHKIEATHKPIEGQKNFVSPYHWWLYPEMSNVLSTINGACCFFGNSYDSNFF